MRTLVIGDGPIADRLHSTAQRHGLESHRLSIADVSSSDFSGCGAYHLVLFSLPDDWDVAIRILRDLRSSGDSVALVAAGPVSDSKRILRLLREGVDEYVDDSDLDTELDAALVRLKMEPKAYPNRGMVVGVIAPSGGAGASTVAANLASVYALDGSATMLLDLRLDANDQSLLLDLRPRHSVDDVCRNINRLDRAMLRQSVVVHDSGVNLLASPTQSIDTRHVSARAVRRIINVARPLFSHTIIDLDRTLAPPQLAAMVTADIVLAVVRLDVLSLRNTCRMLERLHRAGIDSGRVRIVINRYGQRGDVPLSEAKDVLGAEILQRIPNDVRRVAYCTNRGIPVVIHQRRARISKRLHRLAKQVEALVNPGQRGTTSKDNRHATSPVTESERGDLATSHSIVDNRIVSSRINGNNNHNQPQEMLGNRDELDHQSKQTAR